MFKLWTVDRNLATAYTRESRSQFLFTFLLPITTACEVANMSNVSTLLKQGNVRLDRGVAEITFIVSKLVI